MKLVFYIIFVRQQERFKYEKNNEELIALCAQYGIEGIDIVNELMRFKVLDQLLF